MYGDTSKFKQVRERLDAISPSFCPAKWMHTSLHLLNGRTHSCFLPPTHKIPLEEIQKDPSALHNTEYKKQQRQKMLQGERPSECQICWSIEDLGPDYISDRILRGSESWTRVHLDKIQNMPAQANIDPSYMEVSFSSACNFKCSYCSPHVSTKWHEEIKQHGPYPLTSPYQALEGLQDLMPFESEDTPYTEAFWNWWPSLYPKLQVFRITGGEPLLSKHFEKILSWIEAHPHPELRLSVNSNFGVNQNIIQEFIRRAKCILEKGHVKSLTLHTSLDTFGPQAEYIRHGLKMQTFQDNILTYLREMPDSHLSFMSTFNALSLPSYIDFLKWVKELRQNFKNDIHLDIPHLVGPEHMSVRVLTAPFKSYIQEILDFMEANDFRSIEIEKIKRIQQWMNQPQDLNQLIHWRKDFYLFFTEHDRRRGTNFLQTFPEYQEFWNHCQSLTM